MRLLLKDLRVNSRPYAGGAAGYIGYDAGRTIEPSGFRSQPVYEMPDIVLMFFKKIFLAGKDNYTELKIFDNFKASDRKYMFLSSPKFILVRKTPEADYSKKIKKIKEYISEGEVYQVNLSHRVEYEFKGSPWELYLRLRAVAKPQFGAFLNLGEIKVLSASPERFLRLKGRLLETFPVKGTMPRSNNKKEDLRFKRILMKSAKDRAEHIMIVDLLRNDLGRVCEYGSVRVDGLFGVRSFRTVHHMVSRISGRVRKGVDAVDILRATFPGGSVTGAPKVRAMQIIDELEGYSRGLYTGSIGYIMADGSMDFNIAIRTMILKNNRAYYSVGGGIVHDSDPIEEYKETETKLKVIDETIRLIKNESKILLSQWQAAS